MASRWPGVGSQVSKLHSLYPNGAKVVVYNHTRRAGVYNEVFRGTVIGVDDEGIIVESTSDFMHGKSIRLVPGRDRFDLLTENMSLTTFLASQRAA